MALCVKSRTSQLQLPNPTDVKESIKLLKSVLTASVSQIVYARRLLPKEIFEDREVAGLNLKVLPYPGKCKSADEVNNMLTQAFDALEKRYLHTLEMHICSDEDPNHVIEYYAFEFQYDNNREDASVTLVSSSEHEPGRTTTISSESSHQFAYDLLANTKMLVGCVLPPGDNFLLRFRIYYQEGTPDDYDPPGYSTANPASYQNKGKKFKNGCVPTNFHKMIMKSVIEADLFVEDDKTLDTGDSGTQGEEGAVPNQPASQPVEDQTYIPSSIPSSWPATSSAITNTQIACVCGIPVDSLMIQCAKCSLWHHGCCYRILSAEKAPAVFNCLDCYSKAPTSGAYVDTSLQGIGVYEQKYVCMYRYALNGLMELRRVTKTKLVELWHISRPVMDVVIKTLLADKILLKPVTPDQGTSLSWFVNSRRLKEEAFIKYLTLGCLRVPFLSEGAKAIENIGNIPRTTKRVRFY